MALFPKSSRKADVAAARTPFPKPPKKALADRFVDVLDALRGQFNPKDIAPVNTDAFRVSPSIITTHERDDLLTTLMSTSRPIEPRGMSFPEYLRSTSREIARIRVENERIRIMAPEIAQAASIMIPAIMAPNDLRDSAVKIVCKSTKLTDAQQVSIGTYLTQWFDTNMSLSVNLPKWIDEALYGAGSKPLLVIPVTAFEDAVGDASKDIIPITSLESFNESVQGEARSDSWFGFTNHQKNAAGDEPNSDIHARRVMASTESMWLDYIDGIDPDTKQEKSYNHTRDPDSKESKAYFDLVKAVVSTESLSVIDNPGAISRTYMQNGKARANVSASLSQRAAVRGKDKLKEVANAARKGESIPMKQSDVTIFDAPDEGTHPKSEGIFLPLPPESVIPLYVPGTPDDHLGYFVMIDQTGNPINIGDYESSSLQASADTPNQNTFVQLFQAYGFNQNMPFDNGRSTIANLYQNIVESHLKSTAANAGFANVGFGSNASVYRCMLTRFLQQRQTQLLFVPKEMMTYMCFKYAPNGTGVSKLEEVKYILALRTMLVTCRLISAFNNAIDRRKITIGFDDTFTGDVLEHMRTIQREAIRKSAITFTHDPTSISQQITEKSYTIAATGIPGIPQYAVSNESNDRGSTTIDTDLGEDLKNLLILNLDVPPAAMNALGDNEYSRSILTTNLLFSRKCVEKQKVVKLHASHWVRSIIRYSEELTTEILNLIQKPDGIAEAQDAGTINIDQMNFERDILPHIEIFLPPPNIASNQTQFENMESYSQHIDNILISRLPEGLVTTEEGKTVLEQIRALYKSRLIGEFMQEIGFSDITLPSIDNLDYGELLTLSRSLFNIHTAIKAQDIFKTTPDEAPADGGFGGGFGGDTGAGFGGDGMSPMGGFGDDFGSAAEPPEPGADFTSEVDDTSVGDTLPGDSPDQDNLGGDNSLGEI